MYAAKNFLNAVNVPLVPMDDVDASFEFLKQYTEGLILAATKNVIVNTGLTNFSESKELMEAIIDQVMEKFVKPGLTWNLDLEEGNLFKCNFCNKQFGGGYSYMWNDGMSGLYGWVCEEKSL